MRKEISSFEYIQLATAICCTIFPWVLFYLHPNAPLAAAAFWNFIFVGLAILVLGMTAIISGRGWEPLLTMAFGIWLILSPWVLFFSSFSTPSWFARIAGTVTVLGACWRNLNARSKS
ncbi:SPW repeat protein [Mesorhizobium sp. CCNWLW179-1]|uniref:SPW repeat domain-containing protein n=1 Tax=unclassified Mesorhizobium TaxID=325217 RepID=UPI0030153C6E